MSYIKYGVNLMSNYLYMYIYKFLIKCYILLQPYRINLRINYNIVIVCKILVSIQLLTDQIKCINIIN